MTIDKNNEGAWRISDIVSDYLVTRLYYFSTKREAITLFNREMRERKANA
jgi:hypothetical protein